MRRLIKFVTIFFVMVTFLMPLLECFDRWDPPGLSNDTELPIFLTVLFVSLVLVAVVVMVRRFFEDQNRSDITDIHYETLWCVSSPVKHILILLFIIPPLRI